MKLNPLTLFNIESLKPSIEKFFIDNKESYSFFSPHDYSYKGLLKEITSKSKDYFVFLIENDNIAGYGLLRGWSDGYDIPSLGIMIDINHQGKGVATGLMSHLHHIALLKGAEKIRLRVYKENFKAISLYNKLGYVLSNYDADTLVGFLNIR